MSSYKKKLFLSHGENNNLTLKKICECVCIQKYLLASMILEVLCHVRKYQQIRTPLILDKIEERNNTPL